MLKEYLVRYKIDKEATFGVAVVVADGMNSAINKLKAEGSYNHDSKKYLITEVLLINDTDQYNASCILEEIATSAGYSAYEIAKKYGYKGNEREWLASLKGETGAVGPQGPKGEKGDQGDPMTWEKMDPEDKMTFKEDAVADIESEIKTKYYPDMSVGKADNLVGRGDTQDATINFRPSGGVPDVGNGMNITDGTARIKAIKGNSVVYNQQLFNSTFTSTQNWSAYNVVTTISSDGNKLVANISSEGKTIAVYQPNSNLRLVPNHRYLVIADFETNGGTSWGINIGKTFLENLTNTTRAKRTLFVTAPTKPNVFAIYPILSGGEAGDYAYIYSVRLIDLTKEFCAGNEPTSYEEYLQRKPMNIEDEFAYNAGTLVDMKVDSLVSVGDNSYNPIERKARVIGGQKYHITDSANTEDLVVSFYAFDEDDNEEREVEPIVEDGKKYYIFPANGYCPVNDNVGEICVCLEHSYEKPIKPYEVNVKDLSFIKEIATKQGELLFPNGMRSAGSVYDEIRFNPTKKKWEAVKRIGEVDLGSLSWHYNTTHKAFNCSTFQQFENQGSILTYKYTIKNYSVGELADKEISSNAAYFRPSCIIIKDSSYTDATTFKQAMQEQGVKLYYELAEPISTDIEGSENWNLDYLVWDFGTEEALVRDSNSDNLIPSAPFRADINYEPNAVDDIRWSIKYIRALEQRVLALEQKQNISENNLTE